MVKLSEGPRASGISAAQVYRLCRHKDAQRGKFEGKHWRSSRSFLIGGLGAWVLELPVRHTNQYGLHVGYSSCRHPDVVEELRGMNGCLLGGKQLFVSCNLEDYHRPIETETTRELCFW
jgi:hypothetical protein